MCLLALERPQLRLCIAYGAGHVDALDRAVAQIDGCAAVQCALERTHGGAARGDIKVDRAIAFQRVFVRQVFEQRPDGHSAQILFDRERRHCLCRVDRQRAVHRSLIQVGRQRTDLDTPAVRLEIEAHVGRLEIGRLKRADTQFAVGAQRAQCGQVNRCISAAALARLRTTALRCIAIQIKLIDIHIKRHARRHKPVHADHRLDRAVGNFARQIRLHLLLGAVDTGAAGKAAADTFARQIRPGGGNVDAQLRQTDLLRLEIARQRGRDFGLDGLVALLDVEIERHPRRLECRCGAFDARQHHVGNRHAPRAGNFCGDRHLVTDGFVLGNLQLGRVELDIQIVFTADTRHRHGQLIGGQLTRLEFCQHAAGCFDIQIIDVSRGAFGVQPHVLQRKYLLFKIKRQLCFQRNADIHFGFVALNRHRQIDLARHVGRDASSLEVHIRQRILRALRLIAIGQRRSFNHHMIDIKFKLLLLFLFLRQ